MTVATKTLVLALYDNPEGVQGTDLASKLGLADARGLGPVVLAVFNWAQTALGLSRKQALHKTRHKEKGKVIRTLSLADALSRRMREGLADKIKNSL